MVRLLVQDRETPCGSVWVGQTLGSDVSASWQVDWLLAVSADPARPSRQRFRAALGGLVNQREVPVDMMLLADRSQLASKDWETLWRALFDGSIDTNWMDPVMRDRALLWQHFEQGAHELPEILPVARRWSRSGMGSPEQQAQLSALFWYDVGIGDGHPSTLSTQLAVREGALEGPDGPLDQVISQYAGACRDSGEDACLVYAIAAWELAQHVGPEGWAEPEPANDLPLEPGPLAEVLNVLYEGDVRAVAAASASLQRIIDWVNEQPANKQERVSALLLRERALPVVIDPTAAFSDYGTAPWCAALAVHLTLGEQVHIFHSQESALTGPFIQLGDQWLQADAGGLRSSDPQPEGEPMTHEAIYALAVLELAVDQARRGAFLKALRLAGLAERSSSVARGASAALARRCGVAEGVKGASRGYSVGFWSHHGAWPQDAPSAEEKQSVGAELLLAALDKGCRVVEVD
jgi:hypothetical protein